MFKYQKFFANVALFVATMFPASILANQESADKIEVDFSHERGRIKPLHGVNNSPVRLSGDATQHEFAAAGIPFMRTHDAVGRYGGSHFIDIPNIFPNFDADETDSANYDFAFTDAYLKPTVEAGVEIFYRLGVTIETNWRIKAYNIHPPKDFAKWARICEHIIRHYNEGWANGFKWNIKYRIAKGDSALKKIGSLKEGEKLTLSANSVLLLTTREVNVASARNKKIKVSARNINGLDG